MRLISGWESLLLRSLEDGSALVHFIASEAFGAGQKSVWLLLTRRQLYLLTQVKAEHHSRFWSLLHHSDFSHFLYRQVQYLFFLVLLLLFSLSLILRLCSFVLRSLHHQLLPLPGIFNLLVE